MKEGASPAGGRRDSRQKSHAKALGWPCTRIFESIERLVWPQVSENEDFGDTITNQVLRALWAKGRLDLV